MGVGFRPQGYDIKRCNNYLDFRNEFVLHLSLRPDIWNNPKKAAAAAYPIWDNDRVRASVVKQRCLDMARVFTELADRIVETD